jgi:ABC-2 type transport system ATP-binding protein
LIEVQHLTKFYKDFCAVNKISLTINKGDILGLLGPNGAGKTTTLRMLTGYMKPSAGRIMVKDYNMPEHALKIKSLIGYLPESAPLYHNMLVYDYLDYVARIKGIHDKETRYDRLIEMADICGLNSIMHKPVGELSKGLKQRVGLAHAMITKPEVLILDEPTSGLDPNQIVEIRDIIKNIGKEKTIILSTHILTEAEATCNRIAIIHNGRITADDTTLNLKQSVQQHSVIHLSLKVPDNTEQSKVIELLKTVDTKMEVFVLDSMEQGLLSFELKTMGEQDLRAAVYQTIKSTEWIIVHMAREPRSLEKIFRELTREVKEDI